MTTVTQFPNRFTKLSDIAAQRIVVGVEYSLAKTDQERLTALLKFNQLRIRQAQIEGLTE